MEITYNNDYFTNLNFCVPILNLISIDFFNNIILVLNHI